jgi:flavin-dependent dehydrogenase
VGDAAGYVEPFTGEGMTWALESARALLPLAREAVQKVPGEGWDPELVARWLRVRRRTLGSRALIRAVARLTRHPRLATGAVRLLSGLPALAAPLVRRATGPALLAPLDLMDEPA